VFVLGNPRYDIGIFEVEVVPFFVDRAEQWYTPMIGSVDN
jgi:hypothetical protein